MSAEKFIAPKHDMSKHPSMRSHLRGLQASTLKLTLWRREREAAIEAGHRPPELCFEGEIGGHGQYNPTGDPYTPTDLNDPPEISDFFLDRKTERDCS